MIANQFYIAFFLVRRNFIPKIRRFLLIKQGLAENAVNCPAPVQGRRNPKGNYCIIFRQAAEIIHGIQKFGKSRAFRGKTRLFCFFEKRFFFPAARVIQEKKSILTNLLIFCSGTTTW
jgi:hypothetical protein